MIENPSHIGLNLTTHLTIGFASLQFDDDKMALGVGCEHINSPRNPATPASPPVS